MKDEQELKPCPLCGSHDVWIVAQGKDGFFVECKSCDLSTAYYLIPTLAKMRWNSRQESKPLTEGEFRGWVRTAGNRVEFVTYKALVDAADWIPVYSALPDQSARQKPSCAVCGEVKHTPLRRNEMGGYVCLTCIDHRLDKYTNLQAAYNEIWDLLKKANDLLMFSSDYYFKNAVDKILEKAPTRSAPD